MRRPIKHKKEAYKRWKQGYMAWEEHEDPVQACVGTVLGKPKPCEVEHGKGQEGQQERLLPVYQQQNEYQGTCGPAAECI